MMRVHPLVAEFYALLEKSGQSRPSVTRRAGLGTNVISEWGRRTVPLLTNFEAALNAIGYRLQIIPLNQKENEHAEAEDASSR